MAPKQNLGTANCRVIGGEVRKLHPQHQAVRCLASHNFTDRVDVLVPKDALAQYTSALQSLQGIVCYSVAGSHSSVLRGVLAQLQHDSSAVVTLVPATGTSSDPVYMSVVGNVLRLSLGKTCRDQLGIKSRASQFKGVDRYHAEFELAGGELMADRTFAKVLRFLHALEDDARAFVVQVCDVDGVPRQLHAPDLWEDCVVTALATHPAVAELCGVASFDLQVHRDDPDWALDALEYLALLRVNGGALRHDTDVFISQYRQTATLGPPADVVKITVDAGLVPSLYVHNVFRAAFTGQDGWIAFLTHGIESANFSFGASEHYNDGAGDNNTCLLLHGDEFVLWTTVAGKDSY